MKPNEMEQTWADFLQTRWSLIGLLRAEDGAGPAADRAMAELSKEYWPAVYGYLRRNGRGREEAAEITQCFFADVVIGRNLFARADAERGQLRALLLESLRNFSISWHRRETSRARSTFAARQLDAEDDIVDRGAQAGISPEAMFDRRTTTERFVLALNQCREHYESSGKGSHWRLYEECVLHPAARCTDRPPMAIAAQRHGFDSAAAASAALQVVRNRLIALVKGRMTEEEIGEVVGRA